MISREQYRAIRTAAGLADRSARGRLRLTGTDRRSYLQGLLTNDIEALTPGTGCYAALLTAQGRMIADMYVAETGEAVCIDLEGDVAPTVFAHLEQFVFSEDVQVADESAALAQIGVFGPSAAEAVSRALSALTSTADALDAATLDAMRVMDNVTRRWRETPILVTRRDDVGVRGFDLVLPRAHASELTEALRAAGAVDVEADVLETCRVEGGVPRFHVDMTEDTIPLEAGITDRAISQTKGCYVGQEIIIRVLHRGQGRVARRLVGLTLEAASPVPSPGAAIRGGDRVIGSTTSAVWSPSLERPIALGYVHRDFVEPSTVVSIASGDGVTPAVVSALPFVADPTTTPAVR